MDLDHISDRHLTLAVSTLRHAAYETQLAASRAVTASGRDLIGGDADALNDLANQLSFERWGDG